MNKTIKLLIALAIFSTQNFIQAEAPIDLIKTICKPDESYQQGNNLYANCKDILKREKELLPVSLNQAEQILKESIKKETENLKGKIGKYKTGIYGIRTSKVLADEKVNNIIDVIDKTTLSLNASEDVYYNSILNKLKTDTDIVDALKYNKSMITDFFNFQKKAHIKFDQIRAIENAIKLCKLPDPNVYKETRLEQIRSKIFADVCGHIPG